MSPYRTASKPPRRKRQRRWAAMVCMYLGHDWHPTQIVNERLFDLMWSKRMPWGAKSACSRCGAVATPRVPVWAGIEVSE